MLNTREIPPPPFLSKKQLLFGKLEMPMAILTATAATMAKATSEPKYRVTIKKSAQKVVAKAPREIRELLTEAMRGLANNPRPHTVEKMKGQKVTYYRIPVRDWRII